MELVIFLLLVIMFVLLIWVCGKKGFRSSISFALTIIILLLVMVPLMARGHDPAFVTIYCALPIMALIVYLTEGYGRVAHISVAAIFLNFLFAAGLAYVAVHLAGLNGIISDDSSSVGTIGINIQQLLVAGMMLGVLGALTEMVVTQVSAADEFAKTSPDASPKQIYAQAYKVGSSHLSSIIYTLFLAYAGISLPTLILFFGGGATFGNALSYEPLATDIIRILASTVALIVSMPTSTALAVWWIKKKKTN